MALAWSWGSRRSLASSIPRRSVSRRRPGAERPHDLEGEARVDLRRSCRGADRRRARITPRRRRPRAASGRARPDRRAWPLGRHRSRRSEEHTSELQSRPHIVCRLLLEKKKKKKNKQIVIKKKKKKHKRKKHKKTK